MFNKNKDDFNEYYHCQEEKPHFPVWRIVTGIIGLVCAALIYIFAGSMLQTIQTILLIISAAFFAIFIFSPAIAALAAIVAAAVIAVCFKPVNITRIAIMIVGLIIIFLTDRSGISAKVLNADYFEKIEVLRKTCDRRSELYKTLTFISLFLTWLIPEVRVVSLALTVIFPLLALIRTFRYPDTNYFNSGNKWWCLSPASVSLLFPGIFMLIWTLSNQQYSYTALTITGIFILIWVVLFLIFNREYRSNFKAIIAFVVIMILFANGAAFNINRVYDFRPATQYEVTVTYKYTFGRIYSNKYEVRVTPWSGQTGTQLIKVDIDTYNQLKTDAKAYVIVFQGALNSEWYALSSEPLTAHHTNNELVKLTATNCQLIDAKQ